MEEVRSDMKDATITVVNSWATLATDVASTVSKGLSALGRNFSRKLPIGIELKIPENATDTEEGRKQNRRIAVRVTKK